MNVFAPRVSLSVDPHSVMSFWKEGGYPLTLACLDELSDILSLIENRWAWRVHAQIVGANVILRTEAWRLVLD